MRPLIRPASSALIGSGNDWTLFVDRLHNAVVSRGASLADALRTEGVFTARRCVAIDFGGVGFGGRVFADIPSGIFLGCVHSALFHLLRGWMQEIGGSGMGSDRSRRVTCRGC